MFWLFDARRHIDHPADFMWLPLDGDSRADAEFVTAEADLADALASGMAHTPAQECSLRMAGWHCRNDRMRGGDALDELGEQDRDLWKYWRLGFERNDRRAAPDWPRDNMVALLGLVERSDDDLDRVIAAELCRELGDFAGADHLLARPVRSPLAPYALLVSELTAASQSQVAVVFGDEVILAPSERWPARRELWRRRRELCEASEVQRRAEEKRKRDEWAARNAESFEDWKGRERRRMAELGAANRVCPTCGFEYAWDGRQCGHCQGRKPRPRNRTDGSTTS